MKDEVTKPNADPKDVGLVAIHQRQDGKVITAVNLSAIDYRGYGLVVCDLVRHIAAGFKVSEESVWEWVEKERFHPTTQLSEVKTQ